MTKFKFNKELSIKSVSIPGMFVLDLPVYGDARGWFKENYQRQKMEALGLPHLEAVQNNFSYNQQAGVTRGLHAEPWEKFISLANGQVFGVWVDLRPGENFGQVFTHLVDPSIAIFVPRGVANGYQTLEPGVTYTYLVNQHWSSDAKYTFTSLFDESLGIDWPIPLDQAVVSDKDKAQPLLKNVRPMEV